MEMNLAILLAALVLDWLVGDPDWLWQRVPHPVVFFGKVVSVLDKALNHDGDPAATRRRNGAIALVAMLSLALIAGAVIAALLSHLGALGSLLEIVLVAVLLAQKSLADHVRAVADRLRLGGLEGGRKAVSMIVGRNPQTLDRSGVSRAAIESLAENFSDGVVAPAFWYALLGLPGILAYKMLNTADSMIGHRSERHLHFGRWSARADDYANLVPARLSALVISLGAISLDGIAAARAAIGSALRDAGLHRSPNAGWPEAAFAGALGFALGGPRTYREESVQQAWLNGSGRISLDAADIERALVLFSRACFALWAVVLVLILAG
jgi:adenosylcobinamide-phosphate synthase